MRARIVFFGLLLVLFLVGVGVATHPYQQAVAHLDASASEPHIMVIMEENKGYSATLGSCSADPYLCSLATSYASPNNWPA